jgi:Ras-related GTP-binding protein C/D
VTRKAAFDIHLYLVSPSHLTLFANIMPLLHTGRRRSRQDGTYNGPPRQGPVRHISPAQLNLERVHEQNRLNAQKRDAGKAPEPAPGAAAKGKPRLLLMGQRR